MALVAGDPASVLRPHGDMIESGVGREHGGVGVPFDAVLFVARAIVTNVAGLILRGPVAVGARDFRA